jgi:hypothetical protein
MKQRRKRKKNLKNNWSHHVMWMEVPHFHASLLFFCIQ